MLFQKAVRDRRLPTGRYSKAARPASVRQSVPDILRYRGRRPNLWRAISDCPVRISPRCVSKIRPPAILISTVYEIPGDSQPRADFDPQRNAE